ncbi:MAG: methylenetetrahydrofolate--tRNA-(uracil(54)-C(5))-methyltransferase (FADH(2)-oxidizing) TrmFO [Verrucomicrobiota bacterium]
MGYKKAIVVGAGLAGSEAAWQIAERGHRVDLYEMRPDRQTGAHQTDQCAELVCSNSLGSLLPDRASGMLKEEMALLRSLVHKVALETKVPAGGALAVDRELFAKKITDSLEKHPRINLIRQELKEIPQETPTVVASGPLTSHALSESIQSLTSQDYLYFYDALAPIVDTDSINYDICFRASRRDTENVGDYLNCPFSKEEYLRFHQALLEAPRIPLREFEKEESQNECFFEGCLPIEVLAARDIDALRYGPMRPVGLTNPRTGRWPYAAVQLRQDNVAGSLYNLVGFQTNIKWTEQQEILRLIPGLEKAEFVRMGQMHRNTFINSPKLLEPSMQFREKAGLFFAGQIVGVEGYMGNAATGLLAGINMTHFLEERPLTELPRETMLGSLCWYVTHAESMHFQPMKANFGILPSFAEKIRSKRERYQAYSDRGLAAMKTCANLALNFPDYPMEIQQDT